MARIVEQLTPLIISINVRNKVRAGHQDHRPVTRSGRRPGRRHRRRQARPRDARRRSAPTSSRSIANTGDDVEIYGAYVSPDPDLVTFWLADRIDERGWGLDGDTFDVMDGLRELGVEVWFNLGDRDLAIGHRARATARRRRAADRGPRGDRRGARRPRTGAADERPAGPHAGARPRQVVAASGVHDQGARRGARSTTSTSAAPAPPAPSPEVARRDRRARGRS